MALSVLYGLDHVVFRKGFTQAMKFIFSVLLSLAFLSSSAIAEESLETIHSDAVTYSARVGSADFHTIFYEAISAIERNDYVGSSNLLSALHNLANQHSIESLPRYAHLLLQHAAMLRSEERASSVSYLVRRAVGLAPDDSTVLFSAATFYEIVGADQAWSWFCKGLSGLANFPTASVPLMLNILFGMLVAMTLAFLLSCIILLVLNAQELLLRASRRLPVKVRGLLGPTLLLVLIIAPPFAGILVAISIWSLALCFYVRSCRWLGVLAGVLCCGWWLSLPIIETVGLQSRSPLNHAIERVALNSYAAGDEKLIRKALTRNENDLVVQFSWAQILLRNNDLVAARAAFERIGEASGLGSELYAATQANLGVIDFREKKFKEAKARLESAMDNGLINTQVYMSLARTSMSLVDTDSHRRYYQNALDIDKVAVREFEELTAVASGLMPFGAPSSMRYQRYIEPVRYQQPVIANAKRAMAFQLFKHLMIYGAPAPLLLLACYTLLSGFLGMGAGVGGRALITGREEPSLVWSLLPGGYMVSGRYPGIGIFLLGTFLATLMAAMQEPQIFLNVAAVYSPVQGVFFAVAAAILLVSFLVSLAICLTGIGRHDSLSAGYA